MLCPHVGLPSVPEGSCLCLQPSGEAQASRHLAGLGPAQIQREVEEAFQPYSRRDMASLTERWDQALCRTNITPPSCLCDPDGGTRLEVHRNQ